MKHRPVHYLAVSGKLHKIKCDILSLDQGPVLNPDITLSAFVHPNYTHTQKLLRVLKPYHNMKLCDESCSSIKELQYLILK